MMMGSVFLIPFHALTMFALSSYRHGTLRPAGLLLLILTVFYFWVVPPAIFMFRHMTGANVVRSVHDLSYDADLSFAGDDSEELEFSINPRDLKAILEVRRYGGRGKPSESDDRGWEWVYYYVSEDETMLWTLYTNAAQDRVRVTRNRYFNP